MAIFDPTEVSHYVAGFNAASAPAISFKTWSATMSNGRSFLEGSADFDALRAQSLREVERLLLMSASNYRRTHDLISVSATPWAFVTTYYAAFFAASALMGLFGLAIVAKGKRIISVSSSTPGSQQFTVTSFVSPSGASGSHQKFWELFYSEMAPLVPWLPASERPFLAPVSADPFWLIGRRNDVNYDSFVACDMSLQSVGFSATSFPGGLPGNLSTAFGLMQGLLALTARLAKEANLETDATVVLSGAPTRRARVKDLVTSRRPVGLANKVVLRTMLG